MLNAYHTLPDICLYFIAVHFRVIGWNIYRGDLGGINVRSNVVYIDGIKI